MWFAILFTILVGYLIYYFCFKPYNYWKNRGIVYEVPLPLLGNYGGILFGRRPVSQINEYLYKKYSSERYVGIYNFTKPALLIRDIDLVQRICSKDFEHFNNRKCKKTIDTESSNLLTNLKGREWKETRAILNPIFSTDRIRDLFGIILECTEKLTNHFLKEEETLVGVQLYDLFSKFEDDVVSSTCLGVKSDEAFFKMQQGLKYFGAIEKLKLALMQLVPCVAQLFEIQAVPTSKTSFFKALVLETIKKRRLENNVRQDFVHFLMEAKQSTLKKHNASTEDLSSKPSETPEEPKNNKLEKGWTDEQVATQAVMFLNSHGGSEPFIVACSFLACELSLNPDVQVKLQEEIDNVWQKLHGHKLSYEAIFEMEYLNCVVLESLRKWPPLYQIDRQCVKNYFEVDLSIPDDEKIVIERGTAVIIPVMAIHRDPKYFPDPERFNPDRFSPENKGHIIAGSYIPFGLGPRRCIGSKLALLQLKLLFFHLLSKFDLVQTDRTITDLDKDLHRFGSFRAIQAYLGLKPRRVTSL